MRKGFPLQSVARGNDCHLLGKKNIIFAFRIILNLKFFFLKSNKLAISSDYVTIFLVTWLTVK